MSIKRSKARVRKVDKGTAGGNTFYVTISGNGKEPKPLCFRKIHLQPGMRCSHEAGWGTAHVGTGACKLHGGADKRPTITNGMTAIKTRARLAETIEGYLDKSRDELLDLTYHLAATRAIFDEFMEGFPLTSDENYGIWFGRFNALISTLGNLVDKISRVESRDTLTAAQVLYLRATMVDILMRYLPNPDDRERVVKEIAKRMGGDMEITMRPSELSLPRNIVDIETGE